jgi:hypothetical protein
MSSFLRAAAIAAGFALPSSFAPAVAAPDAFAEACVSRGKSSAAHCACESKLARGALDAREQAAMIRAMRGDSDGFRASVAAMGQAPAQAFVGKMQKLQTRTEAECR